MWRCDNFCPGRVNWFLVRALRHLANWDFFFLANRSDIDETFNTLAAWISCLLTFSLGSAFWNRINFIYRTNKYNIELLNNKWIIMNYLMIMLKYSYYLVTSFLKFINFESESNRHQLFVSKCAMSFWKDFNRLPSPEVSYLINYCQLFAYLME